MNSGKKIYFASDFHLGSHVDDGKLVRERKIVRWLDSIKADCEELWLLGDVFDFWFEYKHVVPKGHIRLLGKLAEFADAGIPIHIFSGNHDIWMFGYFTEQFNAVIHHGLVERDWGGKRFVIAHGDGLGPGDHGYKFIKAVFRNKLAQRLFAFLHPWIGVNLARFFSRKSREATGDKDDVFLGDEEYLIQYCKTRSESEHIDYFIFGHRHMLLDIDIKPNSKYVNLGEWFTGCNYATFDGSELQIQQFNG